MCVCVRVRVCMGACVHVCRNPPASCYFLSIMQFAIHFVDHAEDPGAIHEAASARPKKRLTKPSTPIVEQPSLPLSGRGTVQVVLTLSLPPSCHLTEGAPSAWQIKPGVLELVCGCGYGWVWVCGCGCVGVGVGGVYSVRVGVHV